MCIFCDKIKNKENITTLEHVSYFEDAFAVSKGHTLIIPNRHVENYFDLNEAELKQINEVLHLLKEKYDQELKPDGYNIGYNVNLAGGQTVFHCHCHLIPRYSGDVENPRGGVRGVIPSKQKY